MEISYKKPVKGELEQVVAKVTQVLAGAGFGTLTRIDFHSKMQEKLGEHIPPTVILGVCNPRMAFEAYKRDTDVTSLLPCNAVIRETGKGAYSVELLKPTAMLSLLNDPELTTLAAEGDKKLAEALEKI